MPADSCSALKLHDLLTGSRLRHDGCEIRAPKIPRFRLFRRLAFSILDLLAGSQTGPIKLFQCFHRKPCHLVGGVGFRSRRRVPFDDPFAGVRVDAQIQTAMLQFNDAPFPAEELVKTLRGLGGMVSVAQKGQMTIVKASLTLIGPSRQTPIA